MQWHPKENLLAVAWQNKASKEAGIKVLKATSDGSTITAEVGSIKLKSNKKYPRSLHWSPNGKKIVCTIHNKKDNRTIKTYQWDAQKDKDHSIKQDEKNVASGNLLDAVWMQDNESIAYRDSTTIISIVKNKKKEKEFPASPTYFTHGGFIKDTSSWTAITN